MHVGMTFIWVRERFLVFIPDGMRYSIIVDLGGIIPVYRRIMEKGGRGLGIFVLTPNVFRKSAGIMINSDGKFELDLPTIRCRPWQQGFSRESVAMSVLTRRPCPKLLLKNSVLRVRSKRGLNE